MFFNFYKQSKVHEGIYSRFIPDNLTIFRLIGYKKI